MAYSNWPSSQSGACLEDVTGKLYTTIEKIVQSTFDPCKAGWGLDARDLDHCGIAVTGIWRVKNPKLFIEYCHFRDYLQVKTCDRNNAEGITYFTPTIWQFKKEIRHVGLNEVYLFHGTTEFAVNRIIQEGFNTDTSNPNGMFGRGIYFAEEVTKADQYTDYKQCRKSNGTELTLLLCRVLMGNAYTCNKHNAEKWMQPPCMLCSRQQCRHGWKNRYDSVLGSGQNMLFREFVVYDRRQCFPEFVIKYKRIRR